MEARSSGAAHQAEQLVPLEGVPDGPAVGTAGVVELEGAPYDPVCRIRVQLLAVHDGGAARGPAEKLVPQPLHAPVQALQKLDQLALGNAGERLRCRRHLDRIAADPLQDQPQAWAACWSIRNSPLSRSTTRKSPKIWPR